MKSHEIPGVFYLGRSYDPELSAPGPDPLLYDARDLLTHAVIVGMTGSGKTGLGIALIEEAAIDRIPALVVDPKGDMANLLLQFPAMQASDFEPWIDPAEAARAGHGIGDRAAHLARSWREGLAAWDQDPERIALLARSAEFAVYTPGSTAGRPLAILASLSAPPPAVREDAELLAERIDATSAALLALLGIDFDPVQSRESILVANLLQHAWIRGEDLSLEALVSAVQSPPFDTLGVLELETFYPAKERARLALSLNALLASPSFAPWLIGERLDVQKLLWTSSGKPRVSVISIAHLSDRERVFFVSLLLSELLSWMRAQSGTASLRALFYMDEIFGFFPPTAEPPTKRPMLTLLKQARAFGLGCVLATQNPVDLDYKGLANCGTWFLGRLQTERDKLRVLDGLEGALAAGGKTFDRAELDRLLSSLAPRTFLMSNVHAGGPTLFQTRWVLSWLRGPMTRAEIRRLAEKDGVSAPPRATSSSAAPPPSREADEVFEVPAASTSSASVVLPDEVVERFLPCAGRSAPLDRIVYRPALAVEARLHFVRASSGVDVWRDEYVFLPLPSAGATIEWSRAEHPGENARASWSERPELDAPRESLFAAAGSAKSFTRWRKELALHLYRTRTLEQWACRSQGLTSEIGESQAAFLVRCRDEQRSRRDDGIEKLRRKYAPRHAALLERVRQAQQKVDSESEQYRDERAGTWLTAGANLIGALFGRSVAANARRASSTARAASSARKERSDVDRAEQDLQAARKRILDLEAEIEREIAVIRARFAAADPELEPIVIRPRKSDVEVGAFTLLWRPWRSGSDGRAVPAWR